MERSAGVAVYAAIQRDLRARQRRVGATPSDHNASAVWLAWSGTGVALYSPSALRDERPGHSALRQLDGAGAALLAQRLNLAGLTSRNWSELSETTTW
jgi:hypothetical protein